MSKVDCWEFGNVICEFLMVGGLFVVLVYMNKNCFVNQKFIYVGISDIIEDFDNVYFLDGMKVKDGGQEWVICFECLKSWGDIM